MMTLTPEEIDFEYSVGNIILSNHIPTEKRVKMIKEIMVIHGYTQLAKSQEVCRDKEKIASDILKAWYPNDEYKKLDGSELILLNMKCNAVAEYVIATCQGTGKARRLPDSELVTQKIKEWLIRNYPAGSETIEDLADQILAL